MPRMTVDGIGLEYELLGDAGAHLLVHCVAGVQEEQP